MVVVAGSLGSHMLIAFADKAGGPELRSPGPSDTQQEQCVSAVAIAWLLELRRGSGDMEKSETVYQST